MTERRLRRRALELTVMESDMADSGRDGLAGPRRQEEAGKMPKEMSHGCENTLLETYHSSSCIHLKLVAGGETPKRITEIKHT
jgi:hypothetical protein